MEREHEIRMCGESFNDLRNGYEQFGRVQNPPSGLLYIMGFLSDAQEQIAMGQAEQARKTLNAAKFLMVEYHIDR